MDKVELKTNRQLTLLTITAGTSHSWLGGLSCFRLRHHAWILIGLLLLIILGGALLRLNGIDRKTLSHPEVYVPGIDLPEDISEPPPRLTLGWLLWWHFHDEPHPQGYYFLMWVWTKLFGTHLYTLRLPSALLGIGSIALIFWIAWLTYDRKVALLSAGLLAFNGHHIYWSQMARMYSLTCFLGLLSTLLLLQMGRNTKKRFLLEVLYVAVSLLGVFTEIFFWPFLAAQFLWTMIHRWTPGRTPSRVVTLQALVAILGSPMWAHAIYRARRSPLGSPSLTFLRDYISFGFLFEPDYFSDPSREIPAIAALFFASIAAVCISRGLSDRGYRLASLTATSGLSIRQLLPAVVGSIFIILILTTLAYRRRLAMALTSFIPVLALPVPSVLSRMWPLVRLGRAKLEKRLLHAPGWLSPCFFLAFAPLLIVFVISFLFPLLASRLFLLFTPYLVIVVAAGVRNMSRSLLMGIPMAIFLVTIHAASIAYYRDYPTSATDYQALAQQVTGRSQEGDLIFVHSGSWATTPIFYYLDKRSHQFVAEKFHEEVNHHPSARVWIVYPVGQPPTSEMREALSGFHLQDQVVSRRIVGLLYVKSPPS